MFSLKITIKALSSSSPQPSGLVAWAQGQGSTASDLEERLPKSTTGRPLGGLPPQSLGRCCQIVTHPEPLPDL